MEKRNGPLGYNYHYHPWGKESLKETEFKVFWTDTPHAPGPEQALNEVIKADLVIVGAGFTGLWTANLAE